MIGIVDYDFLRGRNIPTVEVMKIAKYYLLQNKHVELINDATRTAKFEKIYVWCNGVKKDYPSLLLQNDKVIYNGALFTGDVYTPMHPVLERIEPYNEIYLGEVNHRTSRRKMGMEMGHDIIRGNWLRMTANGKLIDPSLQNIHTNRSRAIFLTDDRYFFHNDWEDRAKILNNTGKRVFVVEDQLIPSLDTMEDIYRYNLNDGKLRNYRVTKTKFYIDVPFSEVNDDVYEVLSLAPYFALNIANATDHILQDKRASETYYCQEILMYYSKFCESVSKGYKIKLYMPPNIDVDARGISKTFGEEIVRFTDFHRNSEKTLYEHLSGRSEPLKRMADKLQNELGSKGRELLHTPAVRFRWKTWKGDF